MTAPGPGWTVRDIDVDGDFSQAAIGNQVNGDLIQNMNRFVRGVPAMYLGSEEVADRVACYVPARNHDVIEKALGVHRAVALAGPRGSGRETAAIAALRRLHPGIAIRRFSLEDEDAEEIGVKGVCGYIVHAAEGGLSRLGACLDAVRSAGGYLVVVADAEHEAPGLHLSWLEVEPPHPMHVYQRRVIRRNLPGWAGWEEARTLLADALPAEARRLADITERIERRGGDIAARRAEVANAYRGWTGELGRWFDDHREPHERSLLVAAAALSPMAEQDTVYATASSLAKRLEVTMNGSGLAWCPLTALPGLLRAERHDDRISFRRYDYPMSVLRHTLADYPLARPDVIAWLASLPTDEAVPHERRNRLAETFADLAAEYGGTNTIIGTASAWGKDGLADLAFTALSRTCLHPLAGGEVRRALYDWSRIAGTPQTMKLTIARVCETVGQTYPLIALTRLKHLATHGNQQVVGQVLLAVHGLIAQGHRAEVLAAALSWCACTNRENLSTRARRRRRRAGAMLFLELAGKVTDTGLPETLGDDPAIDLAPGWRAVLDFCATPTWPADYPAEPVAWHWLDAALHHRGVRGRVIDVFVLAALPTPEAPRGMAHAPRPAIPFRSPAEIMIELVRRWAAADRRDPLRRQIKEAIVIPLTTPWWLRLLKRLYVRLRTLFHAGRKPR